MRLLTGPPRSGKTAEVLRLFREAAKGAHDVLVLVPTATLAQHLAHELARERVTFRRGNLTTLAQFSAQSTAGIEQVSSELLHLIADQWIRRLQLPEFNGVVDTRTFHSVVASTIGELDAAGNSAAQVSRAFARAGIRDSLAQAFLRVWMEVEAEVSARGYVMRGARLARAAEQIKIHGLKGIATVCLDGFAALPRPELEFIRALASHAEVVVTLPDAPQSPSVQAARENLLQIGATEELLYPDLEEHTVAQKVVPETLERETEEIARRILTQHKQGTPLRRMGVVIRNTETYVPLLTTTFERFGIPCRSYAGAPLLEHPLARFLAGLVEAALTGWDHQATIEALRLSPGAGASSELDYLELKARANYPDRGLSELQALINRPPAIIEQIARLTLGFGGTTSAKRWSERIGQLREVCTISRLPQSFAARDRAVYMRHADVLNEFAATLAETAELFAPAERPDLAQFWAAAKLALQQATYRLRDDRREVVHLLSVQEARQWDLDVVFLCGLVEKQFPRRYPQNALLSDSVVNQLKQHGVAFRTSDEHSAEELFLFSAALGAARHQAVLSYPRLDGRGQENPPSRFFELLTGEAHATRAVRPAPRIPPAGTAPVADLNSPALLELLNSRLQQVSPSGLETYLKCPLQYFFRKTLSLREFPKLPSDRMTFLAKGLIVHSTLANWAKSREPIPAIFNAEFDRYCAQHKIPSSYALEVTRLTDRKIVESFARAFREHLKGEAQIEYDIVLDLDAQTRISGRADLVVHEPAGTVIYDYKFSKAKSTRDRVVDETTLQAPIYIHAIAQTSGVFPAGMLYVNLREGEEFSLAGWHNGMTAKYIVPLDPEWVNGRMGTVANSVAQIRAGQIMPRPNVPQTCVYCDYRHACRHTTAELALAAGDE